MLNERVSSLFEFTGRGQQLQRDVPSTFATNEEDEIADWILKAKDWSEDTNAYLARCYIHRSRLGGSYTD